MIGKHYLIKRYRNKIKFGFSDTFICIFLGLLIVGCILWVILKNQNNKEDDIVVSINVHEELVSLNGLAKSESYMIKCAHQKELVEGHDYLVFYPENTSMKHGEFVHDPECKKCLNKWNDFFYDE